MKIIVDTNIIFSRLLSPNGTISDLLLNSSRILEFYSPTNLLDELEKGVLYKLPGDVFQCWPSPLSIGNLTVYPVGRLTD